jgi:hypothetical protein
MVEIVIDRMVGYFADDVKRINHALKVYGFAGVLAKLEKMPPQQILTVELASVLHDIGIREAERKYNSTMGKYQEIEGVPIARQLLANLPLNQPVVNRVLYIIGHHHSYSMIDGDDFQVLVEADLLVNIFEDQLPNEAVFKIQETLFRTKTGIRLLETMYPQHDKRLD